MNLNEGKMSSVLKYSQNAIASLPHKTHELPYFMIFIVRAMCESYAIVVRVRWSARINLDPCELFRQ